MNDFLWMTEWRRKMHVHTARHAYRRTFMAWKTCQSLLEVSAENLSSDIPIHRSAKSASSYMILHPVAFAKNLLTTNGTISIFFDCQITFLFTSIVHLYSSFKIELCHFDDYNVITLDKKRNPYIINFQSTLYP